jgi:hypothetical protein
MKRLAEVDVKRVDRSRKPRVVRAPARLIKDSLMFVVLRTSVPEQAWRYSCS